MRSNGPDAEMRRLMRLITAVRDSFPYPEDNPTWLRTHLRDYPDVMDKRERAWNQQAWRIWEESGGELGWPQKEFRDSLYRTKSRYE